MQFLDIPPEVAAQIKPKDVVPMPESTIPDLEEPPPKPVTEPEPELPPVQEPEPEPEEEPEQEPEEPAAQQRPDGRQKRINKLTRQRSELQAQLGESVREIETLRAQLGQHQAQASAMPIPSANPRLAGITSEPQLNAYVGEAEAIIDWIDANKNGVVIGEGTKEEKYLSPDELADKRKECEKIVQGAPNRRDEIRIFTGAQQHYNHLAAQAWPELFDPRSQEHQVAAAILADFPYIAQSPKAAYALGLVIEGAKALDSRIAKNGQPAKQHRDIDERAFAPRVPIAPHTPEPPTRTATPSSKQRLNEAMSNLVTDVDGSVESLAKVFGAMSDARRTERPSGQTRVRS
jgi:hypothetical protein